MSHILNQLIDRKFDVIVSGEYERTTDFWGFLDLMANRSDFMQLPEEEKQEEIGKWLTTGEVYVDADISLIIKD